MLYISPTFLDSFQYYLEANDEYADKARHDLLDRLRGISVTTEAMQRGTDFENLVCAYADGKVTLDPENSLTPIIEGMAEYIRGGLRQVHVQTQIMPEVVIHGFIDVLHMNTVYDIKTTSRYEFPKFLRKNQHLAYLAALKDYGITTFKYLITDFSSYYAETFHWRDAMIDELRGRVNTFFDYLEIDPEMSEAFHLKTEMNACKYAA